MVSTARNNSEWPPTFQLGKMLGKGKEKEKVWSFLGTYYNLCMLNDFE